MILENNITFNKSIISIDLETTGLSQEKDKIIEDLQYAKRRKKRTRQKRPRICYEGI